MTSGWWMRGEGCWHDVVPRINRYVVPMLSQKCDPRRRWTNVDLPLAQRLWSGANIKSTLVHRLVFVGIFPWWGESKMRLSAGSMLGKHLWCWPSIESVDGDCVLFDVEMTGRICVEIYVRGGGGGGCDASGVWSALPPLYSSLLLLSRDIQSRLCHIIFNN